MDEQFPQNQNLQQSKFSASNQPKSKYLKFTITFLIIMTLAIGGFFVYDRYFSAEVRLQRETQENYQKYLDWQKNYEEAMKADTYGGKTPEETLQLFIDALKKEDVELASRYFALNDNGELNGEMKDGLQEIKDSGKLHDTINILLKAKSDPNQLSEHSAWLTIDNKEGLAEYTIIMQLNKFSGVWKIESM